MSELEFSTSQELRAASDGAPRQEQQQPVASGVANKALREVQFEHPPLALRFLEVPLPSVYASEKEAVEDAPDKVVVTEKEGLDAIGQLCGVLPQDALLTHIDHIPLPLPSDLVCWASTTEDNTKSFKSNSEALYYVEQWNARVTSLSPLGSEGRSERPPPLLLSFFVPPALDEMCQTSPPTETVVVDSTTSSSDDIARMHSSDSNRGSSVGSESESSLVDCLMANTTLDGDSDDDDDEGFWGSEEVGTDSVLDNDEDDMTVGLVGDVNRALREKLSAAELEATVLTSLDIKTSAPQKILPSSFIRKFSSLYSWEIARILHAFDKLADNFVELLQSQLSSDKSRADEQKHHLMLRERRAAGEVLSREEEEAALFSKEELEEDDLMDSVVQDKNALVQENINNNSRYRFRNSVADLLFTLERSNSADSTNESQTVKNMAGLSLNTGIGIYEVSLHSRQLGMTIENVMERTVVRSVHPNSEASRLHVKRDSVILKIGSTSMLAQTHLETLDALKNTVRPVKLRLCTISLPALQQHRARMQSLVQRRKNLAIGACTTLNWIETRVLWVLELAAFMEGLSAVHPPPARPKTTDKMESINESNEREEAISKAKKHEMRALKLLEKYKKAKYAFFENGRREALVNTRLQVLSEIMQDVYLLMDWRLAKSQADMGLSLSEGRAAVGLIAQSLRDICYTLLQLTNDQQVDLQLIFPDHHTCLVIDRLVQISLNPYMIKTHHIPSLWRLAGGNAPSARLACANLIPVIYLHLSPIQRLRIRGLLNRLLVDIVVPVRAYVLNSVCIRLLHAVVKKPAEVGEHGDIRSDSNAQCEPAGVTLNWISHVLVQGSLDEHVDVRQSALLACNQMIEYHSLGLLESGASESQALSSRLKTLLGNVGIPPASPVARFHTMEKLALSEIEEEESMGASANATSHATMEYFNSNKLLPLTDDFRPSVHNSGVKSTTHSQKHATFDPTQVLVPALSESHIMFCRMLPLISRLVEDEKPPLRAAVVSMCGDFCIWMGGKWSAILLDVMLCCFRDSEEIVRAAAVNAVPHAVLALVKTAVTSEGNYNYESIAKLFVSLIPAVCTMHSDLSVAVRTALCRTLSQVLALLYAVSRNGTLSTFLFLPKMQTQMCDVMIMLLEDKALEVSCEMLRELSACLDKEQNESGDRSWYTSLLFTQKNSQQLTRSITFLSKPPSHWRVRRLVCLLIPRLVSTTTSVEGRTSISNIVVPLLYDTVFEVRKAAARAYCMSAICDYIPSRSASVDSVEGNNKDVLKPTMRLEETLMAPPSPLSLTPNGEPLQDMGQMWLDCFVLPQIESLRTSRVYHQRVLALHMIVLLINEQVVQVRDVRFNILVNIALTVVDDRIPNVRIALCQLLDVLREHIIDHSHRFRQENSQENTGDGSNSSLALKALNTLLSDPDKDVKHFAEVLRDHIEADYETYKSNMVEI